ncbi:MAG: Asp-tRNA(Asn)/Glu-tRNA(Gln) amidotransferase subunit GatC [Verrucomicrobiales bacterium]
MAAPELHVKDIAHLARLELSEDEAQEFSRQLTQVLDYVQTLEKLDVSHVDPTAHATPVFNVFRADQAQDSFSSAKALSNAPRQANDLVIVPKVIE